MELAIYLKFGWPYTLDNVSYGVDHLVDVDGRDLSRLLLPIGLKLLFQDLVDSLLGAGVVGGVTLLDALVDGAEREVCHPEGILTAVSTHFHPAAVSETSHVLEPGF